MKRRLLLLNVVLLGVLALLAWTLRQRWLEAQVHERSVLLARPRAIAPVRLPPAPTVQPVLSDKYADVAQRMLFAKDRNPTVIPDPVAPVAEKPVPPFPVSHGVMIWSGVPPAIILSEHGKGEQRSTHVGDTVGEFTVREITSDYVVFEWDGKKFRKTIAELEDKSAAVQTAAAPPPPPPPPTNTRVEETTELAPQQTRGPGPKLDETYRACIANDATPAGTVVDGFRKTDIKTPMGTGCQWERVQ